MTIALSTAGLLTALSPVELLAELQSLEIRLGRERPAVRWGPRRIDLDLLVHGTDRRDEPGLTLPHPGIAERAFVLVPHAEMAPDLMVPALGRVRALLARVAMACASMASSASGDCKGARPVAVGSCGGTALVPLVMRIHRGLLSGSAG